MKRISVIALCALLSACGAMSPNSASAVPSTPGQALYAALGSYEAALHGASVYAVQPGANIAAIRTIDAVASSNAAKATVAYAQAYVRCRKDMTQPGCINFDFSAGTITSNTALLRNIILQLGAR